MPNLFNESVDFHKFFDHRLDLIDFFNIARQRLHGHRVDVARHRVAVERRANHRQLRVAQQLEQRCVGQHVT
jgi:hypothetical protein